MPKGKPKDRKLAEFRREISELEKRIKLEKDPKAKEFREQQLARAKQQMAKYILDNLE